ncbi:hypothetical protein Y1Q_0012415 [Alligator mississippiensis]|uniref:Uncharacterized protein n=1 Tax=Alligator mississippiensis TaxID=8496 RepID=A0A151NCK3_ALLMI|nr:hypothetical protein Y1Q_0012415 [Alligator mississippiensis]
MCLNGGIKFIFRRTPIFFVGYLHFLSFQATTKEGSICLSCETSELHRVRYQFTECNPHLKDKAKLE